MKSLLPVAVAAAADCCTVEDVANSIQSEGLEVDEDEDVDEGGDDEVEEEPKEPFSPLLLGGDSLRK